MTLAGVHGARARQTAKLAQASETGLRMRLGEFTVTRVSSGLARWSRSWRPALRPSKQKSPVAVPLSATLCGLPDGIVGERARCALRAQAPSAHAGLNVI